MSATIAAHRSPWRARTRLAGIGVAVMGLVTALMLVLSPLAHADDSSSDMSFYKLSSTVATYFSNGNAPGHTAHADDSKGELDNFNPVTQSAADGGSVLGYSDPSFIKNPLKWLNSQTSGSSQTQSYDSFRSVDKSTGKADGFNNGVLGYAYFGAANADLGLDSTSSESGVHVGSFIRGGLMYIAYISAMAVSGLIWIIVKLLSYINVFAWFKPALHAVGLGGIGTGLDNSSYPSALTAMVKPISSWYKTLTQLSWMVLVPILFGVMLISMSIVKANRGRKFKNFLIRILAIGLALPLVGGIYTSVLHQFDSSWTDGGSGASKVVLSTYVDFNQWMTVNRLAVPSDATIAWNYKQNHATDASLMNARNTALLINTQSFGTVFSNQGVTTARTAAQAWAQGNPDSSGDSSVVKDNRSFSTVLGILSRYTTGASIQASDYESSIKASISSNTRLKGTDGKPAINWFTNHYGDPDKIKNDKPNPVDSSGNKGDKDNSRLNPLIGVQIHSGLQSTIPSKGLTNDIRFTTAPGTTKACNYKSANNDGTPAACNMAPLAAYNYLNTSFGPTSLTVYSVNKVASGITRQSHLQVSQVGTGITGIMYWANALAILISIALIGYTYALGMLKAAVKRGFMAIASIPFMMLGSLSGIAKFLVYSICMIAELLTTMFLYQFVSNFIISVPKILEAPFAAFVKGGTTGRFTTFALTILLTLMSIAIIAWITKILMSARVSIMQAIDEIATKVVNQFVGLDPAKDPGAVHAGASALQGNRTAAQQKDLKKVAESSHAPDLSAPAALTAGVAGLTSGRSLGKEHEGGNVGGTNGETGADDSGAIGRDGARVRTGAKGPGAKGPEDAGGTGAPDDKGTGVRSATDSVLGTENAEDKTLARQLARTGRLSDPAHHDQTGVPGTSGVPGKNQGKGKGAGPGKGQNSVATGSPDHKVSGAAHRRPATAGDHPQTGVGSQKASQKPGGNSRTTQSSQSSKAGTTGPRRASSGPAGRSAAQHPQAGVDGRTGQKQAASRHEQGAPGQARPDTPVSAQQSTTTSSGPRPMSSHTTDSTAPTTWPAPSRQPMQSSAPSVPQQSTSANRPVRSTVSSAAPAPAPESRPDTGRPSAPSPQAPAPAHEAPVAQQSIRQNSVPTVIQQPAQPAPAPQVQQPVQSVPQSAQTTRSAHPVQSPRVDRGSETDDDEEV
ncbi:hypothetical protein [Acidipropionibacterium jensenii]|uniref:hypothetical protein n=1 Tax=Acidipropionibacterium jensenii TaxID=1749 RepID=UPI00214C071E|nr:hypothetical protein [Acidipropionibacterium jensenii]